MIPSRPRKCSGRYNSTATFYTGADDCSHSTSGVGMYSCAMYQNSNGKIYITVGGGYVHNYVTAINGRLTWMIY